MNATEPTIAVGLLQNATAAALQLEGRWRDARGDRIAPGDYRLRRAGAGVALAGPDSRSGGRLALAPEVVDAASFSLEATIGIDFHWQRRELQTFRGPGPGWR
jgi:hypothetical protein